VRALEKEAAAPARAAALPKRRLPVPATGAPGAGDRYSRRVALLKRVLPALGLTMLLLVAVWPRLSPLLESVRLGLSAIDLREARELRMLHPRYAGIDRLGRPFVLTAEIGHQVPDRDDLMALEQPRADIVMRQGTTVTATAATAIYQSQRQLLDLFQDVTLTRNDGTRFISRRAHVDLSDSTAEGHDPVTGYGPSGDIAAQGFRILSKGDTIIFTGHSDLLLKGAKPGGTEAAPAALPAQIEEAAGRIEAAAIAAPDAKLPAPAPAARQTTSKPATAPHNAAKPHSPKKPMAPLGGKPAIAKTPRDAG